MQESKLLKYVWMQQWRLSCPAWIYIKRKGPMRIKHPLTYTHTHPSICMHTHVYAHTFTISTSKRERRKGDETISQEQWKWQPQQKKEDAKQHIRHKNYYTSVKIKALMKETGAEKQQKESILMEDVTGIKLSHLPRCITSQKWVLILKNKATCNVMTKLSYVEGVCIYGGLWGQGVDIRGLWGVRSGCGDPLHLHFLP